MSNYEFFWTDPAFFPALFNTLVLVGSVLAISVVLGLVIAMLIDRPCRGHGIVRVILISPFFIMPAVSALIWRNMIMNPIDGLFAVVAQAVDAEPLDWLAQFPLLSIIIIVSWQWAPFAMLIAIPSA